MVSEDRAMSDLIDRAALLLAVLGIPMFDQDLPRGRFLMMRAIDVERLIRAAPRAATEPRLTDAESERFATLEALAEAVAAYLDPENQYTESRLNTVRRLLAALTPTSAPEPGS